MDRKRIEQPDVDINAITTRLSDVKKTKDVAHLMEVYDASTETEAQEYLMEDIVLSKMTDVKSLPTSKKTKSEIFSEYRQITGKTYNSAAVYFKKVQKRIKNIHNIGMVVHHAAAVGQDVVSRMHKDLDTLEAQQKKIEDMAEFYEHFLRGSKDELEDLQDELDRFPEKPSNDDKIAIKELEKRIKKLNRSIRDAEAYIESSDHKIGKVISKKNKAYEHLLNYSKNFGLELSTKNVQNEINEKKVEVLANKFDNDAAYQGASLALNYKDKSYDEMLDLLEQVMNTDRGIRDVIEAEFKVTDEETIDE